MGSTWKSNPTSQPIRFGLIGCGRIAQAHLDALAAVDDCRLTAVVEIRESAGKAVADRYGCKYFCSYDDPKFLELVDAVLICAPPNVHFTMAQYFLSRGVPVLCEKPLTLSSEQADQLVKASHDNDALLMMASKFRYVDDIVKAKSIIESGILGTIVMYENTFCAKVDMEGRWNSSKEISGGGVLIDNGSHSVDIARYLLGPIEEVQTQLGVKTQKIEVEDSVRLQFRTADEVIGIVDLSWSVIKESDTYISLYGTDGTLHVGWQGSRYRQDGSSRWVPFGSGYSKNEALNRQLQNFVRTMRGEEVPRITPEDALASVKVIEAAYVSTGKNYWLPVGSRA